MRYIVMTALIGLFMLTIASEIARAGKGFQDGSKIYQIGEVCLEPKRALEIAKDAYGEAPLMEWSFANLPHFLFWNPEKEAWTIFARVKKDDKVLLCVIQEGLKMRPTSPSRVLPGDPV